MRRGVWMRALAAAIVGVMGLACIPTTVLAADDPDLSSVTLDLSDLPDGFRLVPEDQLEDIGGSAKQVGTALESSLEEASLEQYRVYASAANDELVEMVLVGPLTAPERRGLLDGMDDPAAMADALTPSFTLFVDQSDPQLIDTSGIGDASVGFGIDSQVSSESAVVTNVLGVAWTEARTQFVVSLRGDFVALLVHQYVGGAQARLDFLGAARHVDEHLAAALGLAAPGMFRPGGTFSPAVANHIPTVGDLSTEPSVMVANLLLAAAAVVALSIAMRALNTTLVAHEDALERMLRPARAVGRWWAAGDDVLSHRFGKAAGLLRTIGVLLFYGLLFSFLEDGWRPWTISGLFVLLVMTIAFGIVGTTDDMVELRSARRWGAPAQLVVKPALVMFALGSVALTKIAGLVPGLMIGTPEAFSLEDEVDERDELRLARIGLGTTAAVGLGAWLLATPLDAALDGGNGFAQKAIAGLVTLLVLVFAVAVENLFANLLAFPGSEGATLRRHHRAMWWVCMLAVTALFFHSLINPRGDLAESLESTNVRVVLATVAAFVIFTISMRLWFHRQDRRSRGTAGEAATEPAGPSSFAPPPAGSAQPPPVPAPFPARSIPAHGYVAIPLVQLPAGLRRNPVRIARFAVTALVLIALGTLVGVVLVQHGRDSDNFAAAHEQYLAADCAAAIQSYDAVLDDSRLLDTGGVERAARRERAECVAFLAIAHDAASDPATGLVAFASFIQHNPHSALIPLVPGRIADMFRSENGPASATTINCDRLSEYQTLGMFEPADVPTFQSWCARSYTTAGRDAEAYALAITVLQSDTTDDARAIAEAAALGNPAACADTDRLIELAKLSERPDDLAAFLHGCMDEAAAANDLVALADAQVTFLSLLGDRPDAPAVEAAVLTNVAACDRLDDMSADPALATRAGFIPNITFACAQTAEYLQDYSAAIERYQAFIDANPLDPRATAARDGLARSLIAEARQSGAGELPEPTPTGGAASGETSVVIYNDSPDALRVVLSGPESRIESVPASATSSTYPVVGPLECRTDVPMIEVQVPPGDYDVLVEAVGGDVQPYTGSWTLVPGDVYSTCFFTVSSI